MGDGGGGGDGSEDADRPARSECERDGGGVSHAALAPYEPDDANTGVMTVAALIQDIRTLAVGERDGYSYSDAFWTWQDRRDDTEADAARS